MYSIIITVFISGPQIQRDLVIEYNTRTGICNATMVVLKNDSSFDDISHTIVWCAGGAKCEVRGGFINEQLKVALH